MCWNNYNWPVRLVSSLYLYHIYVDVYIFVYCTQPRQNHELHTNTLIQTCILYLTRPSHCISCSSVSYIVGAVFKGWMGPRAIKYREVENIRDLLGTAVNVQAMVFGNMGDTSGTGVCFSRDPNVGTAELFGEFLINAQGEDVVAGVRTPRPISELEAAMPGVYTEFVENTQILEHKFGDMQDIEFTIQEGKLFMLQTRNGKRGGTFDFYVPASVVVFLCLLLKSLLLSGLLRRRLHTI